MSESAKRCGRAPGGTDRYNVVVEYEGAEQFEEHRSRLGVNTSARKLLWFTVVPLRDVGSPAYLQSFKWSSRTLLTNL